VSTIWAPKSPICHTPSSFWFEYARFYVVALALTAAVSLLGCQTLQPAATSNDSPSAPVSGFVHGGQQPISGATIQLYAAGSSGDGSAATALLTTSVTTNSSGSFNLTGLYTCPTASTAVFLVAIGGSPGLPSGGTNPQIAMMTALGPCGNLTSSTNVEVNEVTTVAATYALAPYMQSYADVGSNPSDAQLMASAFTMAAELANTGSGSSPGVGVPTGQVVPYQKLNTLADIVSTCINSSGGKAGDSSSCGVLFSLASAASSSAPTDTVGAILDIALHPTSNVVPIYNLNPPTDPFQPSLSTAPADWTLSITSSTPSPTFSPAPGTFAVLPSVILSDTNPSAAIYYTTNGSVPTASSTPYSGAVTLSATTTVRAVAIAGGISSLLVAGTYTLQSTEPSSYQVDLSWDAPTSSPDPVAAYNIYRSPSGSSSYVLLNSTVDAATTYVDSTVQAGLTYDYIVESVDASGVESSPSNMLGVTIP
jgi:hypothetical protein